jgi:tagatose-1,6-bisphosphate aldolase non-catalytic subunit AgaZ/GatZ
LVSKNIVSYDANRTTNIAFTIKVGFTLKAHSSQRNTEESYPMYIGKHTTGLKIGYSTTISHVCTRQKHLSPTFSYILRLTRDVHTALYRR